MVKSRQHPKPLPLSIGTHLPVESVGANRLTMHMREIVASLLPVFSYTSDQEEIASYLSENLPIIRYELDPEAPGCLKLTVLARYQANLDLAEFLLYLLKFHLTPGRSLSITNFQNLVFQLNNDSTQLYIAEIAVLFKTIQELELIASSISNVMSAVEKGIKHPFYARNVMKQRKISDDHKSHSIHDTILKLNGRFTTVGEKLFHEMYLLFNSTNALFKQHRSPQHLMRIVYSFAWIRNVLKETINLSNTNHSLEFRLIPTDLKFMFGSKPVIGICIGISHLNHYELFNSAHVMQIIRTTIPDLQAVKGSFIRYEDPSDGTQGFYLEIEKKSGARFSSIEIKNLRSVLARKLQQSIEKVTSAVFMRRNEEEVMKNILVLSNELESITDFPQVIIGFDSQSASHLIFTVTMVRVLTQNPKLKTIEQALVELEPGWEFQLERRQIVNYIDRKYPKEANVFQLKVKKVADFLRSDSSINLYEARQKVISVLSEKLGEIRDYTGGMIIKQNALFSELKQNFTSFAEFQSDTLEDFFYSITPIEAQATLSYEVLEQLFEAFLDLKDKKSDNQHHCLLKERGIKDHAVLMIRLPHFYNAERFEKQISNLPIPSDELITNFFHYEQNDYIGLICLSKKRETTKLFYKEVSLLLEEWIRKVQNKQTLRLAYQFAPLSLDPRTTLDPEGNLTLKMLFEGLMRLNDQGEPECALAESYTISADQKAYTFKLRECYWSNGDRITAYDFAHTWIQILSPNFTTSFSYLFYTIKNAKQAKIGRVPLDSVGITAADDRTLIVELEYPNPYFLKLTALSLYYPINHNLDKKHPDWMFHSQHNYVCSGPFMLEAAVPGKGMTLTKNPSYWDAKKVKLDKISITIMTTSTALKSYQQNQLDWLGKPMHPWEKSFNIKSEKPHPLPVGRSCWMAPNIYRFPFNNKKFRQAIALALNPKEFPKFLPIAASGAEMPLPRVFMQNGSKHPLKHDLDQARQKFQEALGEMDVTVSDIPTMTILYGEEQKHIRENLLHYIQRELKKALGLAINVEALPWSDIFKKVVNDDYDLAILSWQTLINVPTYLLDAFSLPRRQNLFKWESNEYQKVLEEAHQQNDFGAYKKKLIEAEHILIENAPIIPLYHEEGWHLSNPKLRGYKIGETESIDFKEAYFDFSGESESRDLIHWV